MRRPYPAGWQVPMLFPRPLIRQFLSVLFCYRERVFLTGSRPPHHPLHVGVSRAEQSTS